MYQAFTLGNDGKPATAIPLKEGYFEMELPKAFFENNPNSITLRWIDWLGVASIVQVNREREVNGVNASTTHYSISSLQGSARQLIGGVGPSIMNRTGCST